MENEFDPKNATVTEGEARYFSDRQRQANIDMFLHAVDHTGMDFETLLYAGLDFFHSVFLNGIAAQTPDEKAFDQRMFGIANNSNLIFDVLEKSEGMAAEDIATLLSVLLGVLDYSLRTKASAS